MSTTDWVNKCYAFSKSVPRNAFTDCIQGDKRNRYEKISRETERCGICERNLSDFVKGKKKCTSEHHIETDITRNVMTKAHGGSLQPPYFLQSLIFCLISICWLRQLWGTRGKWGCHMTWVTGRESLGIWERAREREMGRLLCAVKRHVVGRTKSSLIQRKNEEWRRWNRETSRERQ